MCNNAAAGLGTEQGGAKAFKEPQIEFSEKSWTEGQSAKRGTRGGRAFQPKLFTRGEKSAVHELLSHETIQ